MSDIKIFIGAGRRIAELRSTLTQAEFASRLGVDRKTIVRWEAGERLPDGTSLLHMATEFGADVNYVLTGNRGGPVPLALTEDEKGLLADYREASGPVRRAARAALQSGVTSNPTASVVMQNIRAPVRGGVAGGNITKGK